VAHQQLVTANAAINTHTIYNHRYVLAATEHARIASLEPGDLKRSATDHAAVARFVALSRANTDTAAPADVYLSALFFEYANAVVEKDLKRQAALEVQIRKYSTADTAGWASCLATYAKYVTKGRLYNAWTDSPQKLQFSVIEYRLPNNATVAVLGDWGTGQDDAVQLLRTIMVQHKPDALIHLGDIYYSGTPQIPGDRGECRLNFLDVITRVFNETLGTGKRIPVFTIPGNHEYYAMATGYFREVLPEVNTGVPKAGQAASYFCLRTEDNGWQFLGMDTGYHDSNPANQFNPSDSAPYLEPSEIEWHKDKLENFSGKTILLSHHQLYSANARLNGRLLPLPANRNTYLQDTFAPYFRKVAAWLWGHEHNMVLYKNGLFGLQCGRLIGASSYEEATSEDPYQVNFTDVPYLDPTNYRLKADSGYYNHGYALITLAGAGRAASISYYQYPSWGGVRPQPPTKADHIYTEPIDTPKGPDIGPAIKYGESMILNLSGFGNIAPVDPNDHRQYYPMLNPQKSVLLSFVGSSFEIKDGATVQVQTAEATVGEYNVLGAWSTPALYYYKPGYKNQNWTIKKADTSVDSILHYGDFFYLVNQSFTDQRLTQLHEGNGTYLTTVKDAPNYWTCQRIAPGIPVNYNDEVQLQIQLDQSYAVGPEIEGTQYYPVLVAGNGIKLKFAGGGGRLTHGAPVSITTTESAVGNYNVLGAFAAHDCYWYKSGYNEQKWKIWKKDVTGDNVIRKGDLVYLTNDSWNGQWLTPDQGSKPYYITTTANPGSSYWQIV